ncbi:ApbE Membrane-associated lipoprotein involved in thiamine biosynthesis [Methylophilaceae bacterium]
MRYLALLLSLLLCGCFKAPLYHSQSYVFGTLVDISIYGETDERAATLANHVQQDLQNLHRSLHAWKPAAADQLSELGQVNAAFAQGRSLTVAPDLAAMLVEAQQLSLQSDGLFNPALGHLIGTWGFQRDEFSAQPIATLAIQKWRDAKPSMADIVIEGERIRSKNSAVKLDLGGYAKGYALDRVVAYLRQQGVQHALINIGGNIIAMGQHGDQPWRVGIQHPRLPNAMATLDLPDGWAIGTSGDYQRYFMLDGHRYCHIIDPRTAYPAKHMQSVTVLVPPQAVGKAGAGVLSDVASKPLFIAGVTQSEHYAQVFAIQDYLLIDDNAAAYVSSSLAKKLHWLAKPAKLTNISQHAQP